MAALVMLLRMLFAASVETPTAAPTAVVQQATAVVTQTLTQEAPVWTPAPYVPTAAPYTPPSPQGALSDALAASAWPPELWATVARIVHCESRGQTTATNGVHYGVMQANVNLWGWPPADLVGQLNHGYGIYLAQGFGAWSCY